KIDLVTLSDRQSVQTTIYNKADLTLVRDMRVLNFVKGMNQLQFSWANTKIDPTSLSLEIKKHIDKIDVVEITYPPETKDVGIWNIKAEQALQVPVEITYFTSGIFWKSYYIAQLSEDQKTCDLKGYVKVNNFSGEDYTNAQTRLVVGKVNILDEIAHLASLQYPYGRPEHFVVKHDLEGVYRKGKKELKSAMPVMVMGSAMADGARPKKIEKQGLSEYFLYTIEGKETIPHGWAKRLLSFKADNIKIKNIYKYELDRYGKTVVRFLTFKNDKKNNLGQTPLPGGEIKVFHSIGKNGELDFIGSDKTKYIPVNKKVELNLGTTLNVKINPKVMKYTKKNILFDKKGNVSGFDDIKAFEVELSNFTDMPATLEYIKNLNSNHFKISSMTHSDSYKKIDQNTIKFTVNLAPHSNKTIGFTLTTMRGERKWQQ
ncbi:MAG: DUF4139 domain-containing protein, partial [Desulfobacteraceae bacterium]|nr:DUF4139 domain-containing protein [Desulfobacteraceae bacterium]